MTAHAADNRGPTETWHRRFGHQSYQKIVKLPNVALSPSLTDKKLVAPPVDDTICEVCPQAHMKSAPHRQNRSTTRPPRATRYGQRICMDLAGPLPPSFPHGFRYCDIFIDEYSLHLGGYAIRRKSDHHESHTKYCADMAEYGGMSIESFHSDNGGEYTSQDYIKLITDSGARKTTIVARSPNMNTLAEAAFWRIFSIMRALLIESGLPDTYWPYAFYAALWILNRTPRAHLDVWTTPYELVTKHKPNISHLRIFGCRVFTLIDKFNRTSKLDPIAKLGYNLGIARNQRGWLVLLPDENRIIVSRTCRFDETVMYKDHAVAHPPKPVQATVDNDDEEDDTPPATDPPAFAGVPAHIMCRTPGCTQREFHLGQCGPAPVPTGAGLPSRNTRSTCALSSMTGVATSPADKYASLFYEAHYIESDDTNESLDLKQFDMLKAAGLPEQDALALATTTKKQKSKIIRDDDGNASRTEQVPRNYHEAIRHPRSENYKKAMLDELESHNENTTWKLVPIQAAKGRKLVGSVWVFDVKRNKDGSIKKYKARLCAQGFSQIAGADYVHTFSNTIRHDTIRILFAFAAKNALILTGADVKTAYLYGILKEIIFMKPPQGYETYDENGNLLVCQLIKAIYGLRQSGERWEARLGGQLREMGMTRCDVDPCLWRRGDADQKTLILVAHYVDDIIIASSTKEARDDFLKELKKAFRITDEGDLHWFLQTKICQSPDLRTVTMDQSLYIKDLVENYVKDSAGKGRTTPADPSILNLDDLPEGELVNPEYPKLIGKLLWVALLTRPDIAFAVAYLSRFVKAGGSPHMEHAYNVLKYLARTWKYQISFSPQEATSWELLRQHSKFNEDVLSEGALRAWTDSSFGGARPPAGYVIEYNNGPIGYAAFRAAFTPTSSCLGEYMAAIRATIATLALRDTLSFIQGAPLREPTPVFCDNLAAVQLSDNDTSSKRLKHVSTRIAFLREQVQEFKTITLIHVYGKGMVADIFTKPLTAELFHIFRRALVGV